MGGSASDPLDALAVARLESHYFSHGGWLDSDQLIGQAPPGRNARRHRSRALRPSHRGDDGLGAV